MINFATTNDRLRVNFVDLIEFVDIFNKIVVVDIIFVINKHDSDIRYIVDNKKRNSTTTQNKIRLKIKSNVIVLIDKIDVTRYVINSQHVFLKRTIVFFVVNNS